RAEHFTPLASIFVRATSADQPFAAISCARYPATFGAENDEPETKAVPSITLPVASKDNPFACVVTRLTPGAHHLTHEPKFENEAAGPEREGDDQALPSASAVVSS